MKEYFEKKVPELDPVFLAKVFDNMQRCSSKSEVIVKFGTKGNGTRPNYQIEYIDKSKVIKTTKFHGVNHTENSQGDNDSYNPDNLTRSFSLQEIERLTKGNRIVK
jgi:hypothetical protein